MHLELISIIGIVMFSSLAGALITYFILKQRISRLKEEMSAYKRSLKGLWENNEQRQKVKSTKGNIDTASMKAASKPLLSTIQPSDLAITPIPSSSKAN